MTTDECAARRLRAFTLPKNLAIAAFNLDTVACLPTALSEQLCPQCLLIARSRGLMPKEADTTLIKAPSDISDEVWFERVRLLEEQRLANKKNGQNGGGADENDDNDSGGGGESEEAEEEQKPHTPKSQADAKETAELRARDARVVSVLTSRNYEYSWSEVYNAVWTGLHETTREQIWVTQSMHVESLATSTLPSFEALVENAYMSQSVYEQIRKDIFRSFPTMNERFFISGLYRGLIAHATLRPDIGYGQGMNVIWGLISMTVSKPQQQLLVAEHVVRNILPYYYTTHPVLGPIIDSKVLAYYFQRRRPTDYAAFVEQFGAEDTENFFTDFCFRHFSQLYGRALPPQVAVRLIDVVMMRGAAALFEFAIRFFHYMYKKRKFENYPTWIEASTVLLSIFECDEDAAYRLYTKIARDITLPLGPIMADDLALRRRMAAQNVFARLRDSRTTHS